MEVIPVALESMPVLSMMLALVGIGLLVAACLILVKIRHTLEEQAQQRDQLLRASERTYRETSERILTQLQALHVSFDCAVSIMQRQESARLDKFNQEQVENEERKRLLEEEARIQEFAVSVEQASQASRMHDVPEWLQSVHPLINVLLLEENDSLLMEKLKEIGIPRQLVDFADPLEYQRNNQYSVFADSKNGHGFLIAHPEDDALFALYPYRYGNRWMSEGADMLGQVYRLHGNKEAYRAYAQVDRPAILRQTGTRFDREGLLLRVFTLETKGELRIIEK